MLISDASTSVAPGQATLRVAVVCGQSAVTCAVASSPMKLLAPISRGVSVRVCTSNFGGGMVAGDQTGLNVHLGHDARCLVGTQASTKIYRNPANRPCTHQTCATLEANALLVLAPDPVQAFTQSSYSQHQKIHLATGAGLALVDWFTSGRAARGERWAFTQFQSRNEVFCEGQRVFLDALRLTQADRVLTSSHRLGRFNCYALLLLLGAPLREAAHRLQQDVASLPITRRGALLCSVSPVHDGAVLRLAGESVEQVGRELHRQLNCLSEWLGEHPWARKW